MLTTAARCLDPAYEAQAAAEPPRVVMLGDSITDYMRQQPWWPAFARAHSAGNYSIAGCGSATVLWQVQHGLLDGLRPEVVTLLVGVNDLNAGATPLATAGVIRDVVSEVRRRCPSSRIIVLSPLPRWSGGQRLSNVDELGRLLADLPEYRDVAGPFRSRSDLFADGVHPTVAGYVVLRDEINDLLTAPDLLAAPGKGRKIPG